MTLLTKSVLLGLCVMTLGAWALSGGTGERSKTTRDDAAKSEQQEPAIPAPEPANQQTKSGRPTSSTSESATVVHASPDAEQVIRRAMQKKIDVKFVDTPLDEAKQFLAEQDGYPVWINETAIGEEGIPTDEPVNDMLEDVTIEQALNWTLRPLGLTWVIEDEVLKVTTEIDAEERLFTRTYDVKKLLDLKRRRDREQGVNGDISLGEISSRTYATLLLKNAETSPKRQRGSVVIDPCLRSGLVFQRQTGHQQSPTTALFQFGGGAGFYGNNIFGPSTDDANIWLHELIQQMASGPWEDVDGSGGTITSMHNMMAVRQTQKVHEEVASLLQAL